MWAAADSAQQPRLVSTARALTHLHLLLVIVIILCVHLRLTTYGVECGTAAWRYPTQGWLTLACAVTLAIFRVCWICSVMDLTLPHQSVPTLGRDTTATLE
jgi:hypothetical protein